MFTFLGENDRRAVAQILADLQRPVYLRLFAASLGDYYSDLVCDLLAELVSVDPRLRLKIHNAPDDLTLALRLDLSELPAILVCRDASGAANIRFCGLPSGYTFVALLESLLLVGGAATDALSAETRAFLTRLSQPVHIQIFVTADDATCPAMVVRALTFAHASPNLVIDTIEARAFPELNERYGVTQTPTMVIDEQVVIPGLLDEAELLRQLHLVTADRSTRRKL